MGELIEGQHAPCTKAHWCEHHCRRNNESEAAMLFCDCDQFDDDDDDDDYEKI